MAFSKELLSQNEIDALLDLFTETKHEQPSGILFEMGMARVTKAIGSYLEEMGLVSAQVKAIKSRSTNENSFVYQPTYAYLERLSIDNALALAMLGAQFGAKTESRDLERPLTALENRLMRAICNEIEYMVEKELDGYLRREAAGRKIADHSVLIVHGDRQSVMQFAFGAQKSSMVTAAEQAEQVPHEAAVNGTQIQASIGRLEAATVTQGRFYKLSALRPDRVLLFLDTDMVLTAKVLEKGEETLLLEVTGSVIDPGQTEGYHLVVAGTVLDDTALLNLAHGTTLELAHYDEAQLYKDGKMVAKTKVSVTAGEIMVKVDL